MVNTTFNWKNFTKPTPTNILYLIEGLKGMIGTISITSYIQGNERFAFWLMVSGAILDFLAKFISKVTKDSTEVVKVEYPSDIANQVIITTETKE